MSNVKNTIFTDDMLRFLYSSPMFQQLTELQQQSFLQRFNERHELQQIFEVALQIQDSMLEVEAMVPKILEKDFMRNELKDYHEQLKMNTEKQDNVYYVPFGYNLKYASPYVILLQQSFEMKNLSDYTKGLILPLLNVCAKQHRDCIIIPFSDHIHDMIVFEDGCMDEEQFDRLLSVHSAQDATILTALNKAIGIFEEDSIRIHPELFIVTDNQFVDFQELEKSDIEQQLVSLNVEVSTIALSELAFDIQPIFFTDKVYFANE